MYGGVPPCAVSIWATLFPTVVYPKNGPLVIDSDGEPEGTTRSENTFWAIAPELLLAWIVKELLDVPLSAAPKLDNTPVALLRLIWKGSEPFCIDQLHGFPQPGAVSVTGP